MIWTEERTREVVDLFLGGLSVTLIGRRYGVTRNTIMGKISRLGVKRDAVTIPARDSAKWTDEMDARLRAMAEEGLTRSAMAADLGLQYNQILSRCRVLKLNVTDGRTFVLAEFTGVNGRGSERSKRAHDLAQIGAPARIINEAPDPNIKGLTCIEIPHRGACKWPLTGTGADMVMCAKPSGDETYCPHHRRMAFTPLIQSPARARRNLERSVRHYA